MKKKKNFKEKAWQCVDEIFVICYAVFSYERKNLLKVVVPYLVFTLVCFLAFYFTVPLLIYGVRPHHIFITGFTSFVISFCINLYITVKIVIFIYNYPLDSDLKYIVKFISITIFILTPLCLYFIIYYLSLWEVGLFPIDFLGWFEEFHD